jgi:hypothetical protein
MEEDPDNDGEILITAVIQCDTEPKRVRKAESSDPRARTGFSRHVRASITSSPDHPCR